MRILVVGDTHGNHQWLKNSVYKVAIENNADIIFQIGDFGYWPSSNTDLDRDPEHVFLEVAKASPVPMYWIDGNHEDHHAIEHLVHTASKSSDGTYPCGGNLTYVPRGTLLEFDQVRVFACGGAHSIDKARRWPGISWFQQEDISNQTVEDCLAMGTADLMITHDCPAGWTIPGIPDESLMPYEWSKELPACKANQVRLHQIMKSVQPKMLVHGHFHSYYGKLVNAPWGKPMLAVGLDCDPSKPSEYGDSNKYLISTMLLNLSPGRIVIEPLVGDDVSHPYLVELD